MKKILLFAGIFVGFSTLAQNEANSTATNAWGGYMTVFDLSDNWQFGNAWGVSDLKTDIDISNDQITLSPNFNTYANAVASGVPGDIEYWTNSSDGGVTPGPLGNKIMEATTLVEPVGFNGQDLIFKGKVVSNTLDAAYSAKYFIKALDPNLSYADALGGAYVMDLPASGEFSVSVSGAELAAGLIIQYGFVVRGVNANPADEGQLGNIIIQPSTLSIDENENVDFFVYPNPVNEILTISSDYNFTDFEVITLDGKNILSGYLPGKTLDVSVLTPGSYFIALRDQNGVIRTRRFIKK